MPHLIRRMQCLLETNKKNIGTTIQTCDIGTFKLHNIYKKIYNNSTVLSDLKKWFRNNATRK